MISRQPIDAQAVGLMLVLCMIWGFQQVVMKAAAVDIAPMLQIALRSGMAALLVLLMTRLQGERFDFSDGTLGPGLLAGFLFALEFFFVAAAVQRTSASHLVVFLYTSPIFAALGLAWRLPSERLRAVQWCGIALAVAGLAVAFLWREASKDAVAGVTVWGDLLALLAGASWGATTVVVRCSSLSRASAKQTLFYQLAAACGLCLIAAVWMGEVYFKPTTLAWASLLYQGIVGAFASFLAWFWLLRQYLASRLGVFVFTAPLFGVAFGVWLLGERLEPSFVLGAALVLAGIVLVSGYDWLKPMPVSALPVPPSRS